MANVNVESFIKYYPDIISKELCERIITTDLLYSKPRINMPDEFWIQSQDSFYSEVKICLEKVIKNYKKDFPDFSTSYLTNFRINRYSTGEYKSKHIDAIVYQPYFNKNLEQRFGFPQVSILLFLNDDYKGGELKILNTYYHPFTGSAIIFPSNFMYPHSVEKVEKGFRWSIVTWLM